MKGSSSILALFSTTLVLFLLLAAEKTNGCRDNDDCESLCDPGNCLKNCLGLPSNCSDGQCYCPFGPGYDAGRALHNTTCNSDDDCKKLCPSPDCNTTSCRRGICECGCHQELIMQDYNDDNDNEEKPFLKKVYVNQGRIQNPCIN